MKGMVSGIMLMLLLIGIVALAFDIRHVKAETEQLSKTEPFIELVDFYNGTRQMIIDYNNGTVDAVIETFTKKASTLLLVDDIGNQSLYAMFPTSLEESTQYINLTQTLVKQQEVLLGFTYELTHKRLEWNATGGWWFFKWQIKAGVTIDIRFGLRLPVKITLEYPEQMTWGCIYTLYATLNPIDKPDYDELLFMFKANVWAESRIAGLPVPLKYVAGPNIDKSLSFQTPLSAKAPLPSIEIDIFDVIKHISPDLSASLDVVSLVFKPFLVLEPVFGSQKITAIASALGDARIEKGSELIWHIPGQKLNFTVSANDYNGNNITDNAKIKLSNFRYYFTEFSVNCKLRCDFTQIINALGIKDVEVGIFTIDMSWLIDGLYLGAHAGYQDYVHVTIIVYRSIGEPEKIDPRDIAIISGTIIPHKALFGQIVNITVMVRNLGSITENFSVTIRADNITIGTQFINQLSPDSEIKLIFLWNTTSIPKHYKYTIYAEASSVPNEIDTDDNKLAIGIIVFRMPGDVNFDGIVDMTDIAIQIIAYGSYTGHIRWNSMADENKDGKVDLQDISLTAKNFGKTYK
ncbi:MAG: CARDB domain-containing protein [Nitrososphaeria archaeon]